MTGTAVSRTREESDGTYHFLTFHREFNLIANGDVVSNLVLPFSGTVERFDIIMMDAVTTAGDGATFNLEIDTTDVSGSSIVTASATATPAGKIYSATPTAARTFVAGQTLSIEASSVTDYVEGSATFLVLLRRAS